ncbi:Outer membrane protein assembly factor BamB [Botrimarina colliarenosi]|uniref:Outer membrane protein assembly factor BamB n=1 Tax=Botrimarina colliarenosi TaxID=2528001 RepID=A0A5C6AIL9_9BACT|nr:PQQ-binding-like beta-propeller repeat protein [Botrimarina colliarenosi]TWT99236.1 Outer membrane protein assembly factor BamB [Botrimarina colliarenosi]
MKRFLPVLILLVCSSVDAADSAPSITKEWPQWGGDGARNNTPVGVGIPTEWNVGDFDFRTGEWDSSTAENVKWAARLGSQTYGNCVIADGKAFIGTNNSGGWLERYPADVDLGCLLCFDIADGKFLWQHSSEKLKTGRVHDWPLQGICSASLVEGKRLWFVTSRGEVRCLDTEGFHDGENDGPKTDEAHTGENEADVIWVFDMMRELGVSQHNMCSCSVTAIGDTLLVNTSNGLDESHINLPSPNAPSFIALDKNTGEVLWTDKSPGDNILHGQWSSPTVAEIEMPDGSKQMQVIYGGGDGWVYAFDPLGDGEGGAKLLWKFDANPKQSVWILGGRGTRNNIIATPVVYKNRAYVAVGQDPEHGEGVGHLWCIDPTGSGDVSPELAFNAADPSTPIPPKRIQAVIPEEGDLARPNPNSKVIWHYSELDSDGDGEIDPYLETMHRSCGTVAIKDDILYIADFSGIFHCLDAMATGSPKVHWTYDMFAAAWGSPLIVDGKVYIGDEDGDVAIFNHSTDPNVAMTEDGGEMIPALGEINMGNSVYSTPIIADNVLYISNRTHLFAIEKKD